MSEPAKPTSADASSPPPPVARVAPRRFSFVWIVPVLAVLGVGWYVWQQTTRERGPMITITFPAADGLEPGDEIRHRGVTVGVVRTIGLDESMDTVEVTAELAPDASGLAAEGTAFWIVRPQVSLSGVSGLETILGPRYIGVRPGSGGTLDSFQGLAGPPTLPDASGDGGLTLVLSAGRAGPVAPGAPVLFRDLPVGFVRDVKLARDASAVEIIAVIDPAYARLVRANSRFWLSSGVGVDWGLFRGLSVRADSLDTLIEGAIGFATPDRPGDMVADGHPFEIAPKADQDWLEWDPSLP